MTINGGSDLTSEDLTDLLADWLTVWQRAAVIQSTFPTELRQTIATKTSDPGVALTDHAALLAMLHPEVIEYMQEMLVACEFALRQNGKGTPRRRDEDDVLDNRELTRRLRQIETLVSGAGSVLIEARPRIDRRAKPPTSAGGDPAGR